MASSTCKWADGTIIRTRKRPCTTSTSDKIALEDFGEQPANESPIPTVIDLYDHNMNAVDRSDQLGTSFSGEQRTQQEGWPAFFESVFHAVLVNCWLISKHNDGGFKNHEAFRMSLYQALFKLGKESRGKRKRLESQQDQVQPEGSTTLSDHQLRYMNKERDCRICSTRSKKRRVLRPASQGARRKRSKYGCTVCGVHLCKEGPCFSQYHSLVDS